MDGTVALPVFLLKLYQKELCIRSLDAAYLHFAKLFSGKKPLDGNIPLFGTLPYPRLGF